MKNPVEWPGAQGSVFDAGEIVAVTLSPTDQGLCRATVHIHNGASCAIAHGDYDSIARDIRVFAARCAEAIGNHGLCVLCGTVKGDQRRFCIACEREVAERNLAEAQREVRDATS